MIFRNLKSKNDLNRYLKSKNNLESSVFQFQKMIWRVFCPAQANFQNPKNFFPKYTPGLIKKRCVDYQSRQKATNTSYRVGFNKRKKERTQRITKAQKRKREIEQMRYYCLELKINFDSSLLAFVLREAGFTIYQRQTEVTYLF